MIKKLKQQCGETLIESMVSLLICLLSMMILTTTVLVTNRLNTNKRAADEAYRANLEAAECMSEDGLETGVLSIQFDSLEVRAEETIEEEKKTIKVNVNLYGGTENDFISYQEKKVEEAP